MVVRRFIAALAVVVLAALAQAGSARAMEFQAFVGSALCPDCSWIYASGEINPGDASRLRQLIAARSLGRGTLVAFDSPGGSLYEGMKIGGVIRAAKMNTIVLNRAGPGGTPTPAICASACAYAYLGGVKRLMGKDARYGLHQFSSGRAATGKKKGSVSADAAMVYTQETIGMLSVYILDMGASQTLIALASTARPDEIYWLDDEMLAATRVVTIANIAEPEWDFTASESFILLVRKGANNAAETTALICPQMKGKEMRDLPMLIMQVHPKPSRLDAARQDGRSIGSAEVRFSESGTREMTLPAQMVTPIKEGQLTITLGLDLIEHAPKLRGVKTLYLAFKQGTGKTGGKHLDAAVDLGLTPITVSLGNADEAFPKFRERCGF